MDVNPQALFDYMLSDLRSQGITTEFFSDDYFPGANSRDVFALRLVKSFYKKYVDSTSPDADQRCLEKFKQVNDRCLNWRYEPNTTSDEEMFGELIRELDSFFHPDGEPLIHSYYDLLRSGRCGPGASLGANGYDFYTKLFSSRLSSTSLELYQTYGDYLSWFPNWVDAELSRFLNFGGPEVSQCSSLLFVPKSRDISRSICVEPSLNMFYQLGLAHLLTERLRSVFNIDLSVQPDVNRRLARSGSIDGKIATIDLSSASDSMSVRLCELVFPSWFLDILCILRTPYTRTPYETLRLNMISTMGNGFTFPLQTIFFASVVRAVARIYGISLVSSGPQRNYSVFGDDIICPSEMVPGVYRLLDLCGFEVNSSKSYYIGPFRESCGHDYYHGENVRGVYIKSLSTPQDRYVAINLLNDWSARSGLFLPNCVGYLRDSVRELAIPPWENVDAGIRTPSPPKGSYDKSTQRFLYRCCKPVSTFLTVREDRLLLPPRHIREGMKRRIFNPQGLWISFLNGNIENSKITLRQRVIRYRTETLVAPNWCYTSRESPFAGDSSFWRRDRKSVV